jgi:protein-S-isoprenylcysteine O-methyltransferase Ste14
MNKKKTVLGGAIVLYFVVGLEILIMISPFAGFFYMVFNPFLLQMARHPATRWLSAFFLPHLVMPPDAFLKFLRVSGSVLFVGGMAVFIVCAIQIYAAKLLKKGTVVKGLYASIRHPQYLGLAVAGIGLSILWPRFLVAVLWLAMVLIYYFLARDEERRMLKAHKAEYEKYVKNTGMFLPRAVESRVAPSTTLGKAALFTLAAVLVIGGAFSLRAYTTAHLPLWRGASVVALSILPEDARVMDHRMADVLQLQEIRKRLKDGENYLVYVLPENYIMQGLIANTGSEWKLYKRHHAIGMISDWIFHPFRHLREGHHAMHGGPERPGPNPGAVRRLVFLRVRGVEIEKPSDVFSMSAERTPEFMADVDMHEPGILDIKDLPQDTGWGKVPTPVF